MYKSFVREKRFTSENETLIYGKALKLHLPLVFLVILLSFIGIAMLYSVAGGDIEPWARRQFLRFALLFPIMLIIALINIQFWLKYSYVLYFLGILLLVTVMLTGYVGMGAKRWIDLGPVNIQPSELMKIFLILALSRYFHNLYHAETDRLVHLMQPVIMILVPFLLVLKQPNLGTATIIMLTGIAIFFATGVGWKKFIVSGLAILIVIPMAWHSLHDYQKQRVMTFLDPDSDPLGAGYNIIQSKIAIGSGGFFGKGFLKGTQGQLNFLPEKHTDFIFTIVAEEFGFIGGVGVVLLFLLLLFACLRIGLSCHNHFSRLVCIGVAAVLFIHIFINMAMVMGMVPVVGVPLPFLSYGGSIMMSMMFGFGLVLSAWVHR